MSAYIHDFEQMDREVLERWAPSQPNSANRSQRALADRDDTHALPRVSLVRQQVEQQQKARREQARRFASTAWRLERKGKHSAAMTVYKNALKLADGQLARKIRERMDLVSRAVLRDQQQLAGVR